MLKKCHGCGVEQPIDNFYAGGRYKDGHINFCKKCCAERQRAYTDRPDAKERRRQAWDKDREKWAEQKRAHYYANRERILEKQKEYRSRPDVKARMKAYRREYGKEYNQLPEVKERKRLYWHKESAKQKLNDRKQTEKYKEQSRRWQKKYNATPEYRERHREYNKKRRAQDPVFAFAGRMRCLIHASFSNSGYEKGDKAESLLGCDFATAWQHLTHTWKINYGTNYAGDAYHIDHIVPLSSASTEEGIAKLCHYTNLQMLTPEDNLRKGHQTNWSSPYQESTEYSQPRPRSL